MRPPPKKPRTQVKREDTPKVQLCQRPVLLEGMREGLGPAGAEQLGIVKK